MGKNLYRVLFVIAILGILLAGTAGRASAGCVGTTQTFEFGDTVIESCTFDDDMIRPAGVTGHGLIVGATDITIDGNGFCLDGGEPACVEGVNGEDKVAGIYAEKNASQSIDKVSIRNLEVKNFCHGIQLIKKGPAEIPDMNECIIENCKVHDNGDDSVQGSQTMGIKLNNVSNSIIKDCEVYNQEGDIAASGPPGAMGIYLCKGNYNLFTGNDVHDNQKAGMFLRGAPKYNTISHNYAHENGFGGIRGNCVYTDFTIFEYNYSTNNYGPGIFVGGTDSTIRYNICTENKTGSAHGHGGQEGWNDGNGIQLNRLAYFADIYRNTCCGNEADDIWVLD
ncbi:MAG: right-handed parallel beta-helix repeat-containing protein, partial [Proteobacteria bacterium]|nr:right-handed parallel beta-helix repeat-containing protein [Pseudomonadota bacterium]